MSVSGIVTNISRGSIHDGPGIRTVVYLKGCGLQCKWCHNPETLSTSPDVLFSSVKCIHCGRCLIICPEHHKVDGDHMKFDRIGCLKCGKCAEACPTGALMICGKPMTVQEVMEEVCKDFEYYKVSGGGVTLSGGECLLQPMFSSELLKQAKNLGINTAVESAFFVSWDSIETVIPFVDLFFADLKLADSQKHKFYTGQDNVVIIKNIKKLAERAEKRIIIRIPLIPGINDSKKEMSKFASIIRNFGNGISGIELLRYNYLARSKYEILGALYNDFGNKAQSDEKMKDLANSLSNFLSEDIPVVFR